jgi:predicted Rossmann fold nucleotide-binding protein DprA/Smf involved in DNA uptake
MGARPVLTPRDVLQFLGIDPPDPSDAVTEDDGMIRHLGPGEAATADELASRSGETISQVLEELLKLELDGLVLRQEDGRYRRVGAAPPKT